MNDLAYAMAPAGGGNDGPMGLLMGFFPLVVMFAIFYFIIIKPQQKKQKEHKNMLANLKEGDNVITTSGIYGLVVKIKEDVFTLQIAEQTKIKISRESIAGLKTVN
jgi:preprotein translocase subunit YajC